MSNGLIIFDLDGVLIDSKDIHFNALNLALDEFGSDLVISRDEQDSIFEGLTTKAKLNILTQIRGLPEVLHDDIWKLKQEYSSTLFSSTSPDQDLINLFKFIKFNGIQIGIASNSIRKTLDGCIKSLGLSDLVDYSLSNEDVDFPKPNPEIYNKVMSHFGVNAGKTVIFEDSPIGIAAAQASGAAIEYVKNRSDIGFDRIVRVVNKINEA
jgi:beta-phosphoglucomutase